MKKILIAGASVAALAMAAVPFAGVSADVIDTVEITISSSCSVAADASDSTDTENLLQADMVNHDEKVFDGASGNEENGDIYVTCNASGGWNITAQGFSNSTAGTTTMVATGNGTAIPTAASPAAGTSAWAFKVVDGSPATGATISTSTWTAVPSNATRVAYKNGAISGGHIETNYMVSTSDTQEADTYTGMVKYVVSSGVGA